MMKRRQREFWAEGYFSRLWSLRKWLNSGAAILFVIAIFLAAQLRLEPSFSQLLPQNLQSVQQFEELMKRFGGNGKLLVAIEGPSFAANKKFSEDLAAKLRPHEGTLIRYFDYRFEDVQRFFETYGLHYLDTQDLFRVKDTLKEEIQKQKDQAFGSVLGIDDLFAEDELETTATNKTVSDKDLQSNLDPRVQRFLSYPDAYLGRDDGKLLVIAIQAKNPSLSQGDNLHLSKTVRGLINELNPESYDPKMKVSLSGNVQKTLDELSTIKKDISGTAILLVALILSALILFLWSVRWIVLIMGSLLWGVALTFGFTQLALGHLNTMTAFLSSLVAGTGINYGIILISRYIEERRNHPSDASTAMIRALAATSVATLLASSTTAASFISLLSADNKGFSQFGIIGGMGVLLCWISSFVLLPIWIHAWELRSPSKTEDNRFVLFIKRRFHRFGDRLTRNWAWVLTGIIMLATFGASGVSKLFQDPLEYDFSKLRNRDYGDPYGSHAVERRVQKDVYNSSLTPAIVLLETIDQAKELCPRVRNLVDSLPEERRVFESCRTMYELLPKPPVSKEEGRVREQLRRDIQQVMGDRWLKFSDSRAADWMMNIHKNASQANPELKDIPDKLLRIFEDLSGARGFIGFIYPVNSKPLEDGRNLLNFTQTFRHIWLPKSDTVVSASGENFVLADLLRGIKIDGPRSTAFAFFAVLMLAFLLTGSLKSGLLISACMLVGTWSVLAIQGFLGVKYNFLNFIALPLTFGIGVDYPINVFLRMRELDYRKIGTALSTTGVAVLLCSLTTIIGYLTLMGASNQALVSFAKLALIGEIASIACALVLLPVLIRFLQSISRRRRKDSLFQLDVED